MPIYPVMTMRALLVEGGAVGGQQKKRDVASLSISGSGDPGVVYTVPEVFHGPIVEQL